MKLFLSTPNLRQLFWTYAARYYFISGQYIIHITIYLSLDHCCIVLLLIAAI